MSEKLIASARSKEALHYDSSRRIWCQFHSDMSELIPEKAIQNLQNEAQLGADYMASDPHWRTDRWKSLKLDDDKNRARSAGFTIKEKASG